MNVQELEELGQPKPGSYDAKATGEFVEKLLGTGRFSAVTDEGLQSGAQNGGMALVIRVNPLNLVTYNDTPVTELLDIYSELKGVNLIRDAGITAANKLSVVSKWPLTKEEAIRLFETTFLLNGFYLIAAGDHSVKVLPNSKDPKQEGIAMVRSLDDLIGGEVISSFVLKLKWIDPESATKILTESFGNLHSYGRIVPVPSVGELVITENSELIRRMKDLLDVVDRPPEAVKQKFVKLSQANADRVAQLILKILERRKEASSGGVTASAGGGRRTGATATQTPAQTQSSGGTAPAGGASTITAAEKDLVPGEVQLIPDVRTNRILVVGSPRNVDYVEKLITEFDVVVELSEPYEQPLNYVSASELLPILSDLLQEEEEAGQGAAGGAGTTRTTTGGLGKGAVSGGASSAGGASAADRLSSLSEPGEQKAAESLIVGKTRLIADNRANSILVIGQPEARKKVKAILEKLDKRPMQVFLATVIGSLTVGNNDEFSFNILQRYSKNSSSGVNTVAGGTNITTGAPLSQSAASFQQLATMASGALPGMKIAAFVGNTLDLYLQALTATTKFRIASRPSVFTSNNKKAVIFNGKKIAVPTGTVTSLVSGNTATSNTGSLTSNIQYQDVVLKIEVVPLINSAREVSLQIVQTNDTVLKSSTNIGGGVQVPEISTQELTTTVTVPDRSTILIGGLITQTDQKTATGVPFLSSVPLLGNLFKTTADTTERQELVVLIQPSVVNDVPELREVSRTERDLTGFSSKELSPLSMKVGSKTPPDMVPLSSPEAPVEPATQE